MWKYFQVVYVLRGMNWSGVSFVPRNLMLSVFPRHVSVSHDFTVVCFSVVRLSRDVVLRPVLFRR